ncbi:MAG: ketoacyl-ACP synthase III [Flavobacteriales bacterium]|nr:ketoacyl-ACP synthase III [Flavobacteriales bacterium]
MITGTGSEIPKTVIPNEHFLRNTFYYDSGELMQKPVSEIVQKFFEITEIEERRYAEPNQVASDLGLLAAKKAIASAGIDKESLDYIIVAHNFGDVDANNMRSDLVPTIASRIKQNLGIVNPYTVSYDVPFGCPGWLQALIQAHYFIQSGEAKKVLVIGTETLSRVSDPHDVDSMLYSDGAGAVVVEAREGEEKAGILHHLTRSDTIDHCQLLKMSRSYNNEVDPKAIFLKMNGRKLYEYALNHVPQTVQSCLNKAGLGLADISKVLMHQANAKMNKAILLRLFKLYNYEEADENTMPMTISKLGNNSVATLPILLDLLLTEKLNGHRIHPNQYMVFSSVGAGMNVNTVVYKMPG